MTRPAGLSSLISSPAAGFDQPFEMLSACHERMQRMLVLLQKLREHMAQHGGDEQARLAARDVGRYFDQAAPHHHRDEELHVFPPLIAQADPSTLALVGRLQHDHLLMESRWVQARRVLAQVAEGNLQQLSLQDRVALEAFAGLYADHLLAEEQVAYPAAAALIEPAGVAAMGQEMARRRGAA